jgi:hypothetical protein
VSAFGHIPEDFEDTGDSLPYVRCKERAPCGRKILGVFDLSEVSVGEAPHSLSSLGEIFRLVFSDATLLDDPKSSSDFPSL